MLPNSFLAPDDMKVCQGLLEHAIPWFLELVFDTRLNVTSLMGHLGCLASRWSFPVELNQPVLSTQLTPDNTGIMGRHIVIGYIGITCQVIHTCLSNAHDRHRYQNAITQPGAFIPFYPIHKNSGL